MNQLFRFLRNLDKRKLIFILQRASAILLPISLCRMRKDRRLPLPGEETGHSGHCHRRPNGQCRNRNEK